MNRWSALVLAGCLLVVGAPTVASGSSIIELIGGDPFIYPLAPQPSIFFTPDPAHQLPPNPPPVPNPVPVPNPKPGSKMTWDRQQDAPLPLPGSSFLVPIQVSECYLAGGPVAVGESFFDVFFTLDLDPSVPSTGQMTIVRGPDPGAGAGTFVSVFVLYLDVHFEPVGSGGGTAFNLKTHDHFTTAGTWVGLPVGGEYEEFMIDSSMLTVEGTHGSLIYLDPVPEPATFSLLALGGLMALRRRR
jgi:hypothetical protein